MYLISVGLIRSLRGKIYSSAKSKGVSLQEGQYLNVNANVMSGLRLRHISPCNFIDFLNAGATSEIAHETNRTAWVSAYRDLLPNFWLRYSISVSPCQLPARCAMSTARHHWLTLCQPVFKHRDPFELAAMLERAKAAPATVKPERVTAPRKVTTSPAVSPQRDGPK